MWRRSIHGLGGPLIHVETAEIVRPEPSPRVEMYAPARAGPLIHVETADRGLPGPLIHVETPGSVLGSRSTRRSTPRSAHLARLTRRSAPGSRARSYAETARRDAGRWQWR